MARILDTVANGAVNFSGNSAGPHLIVGSSSPTATFKMTDKSSFINSSGRNYRGGVLRVIFALLLAVGWRLARPCHAAFRHFDPDRARAPTPRWSHLSFLLLWSDRIWSGPHW